MDNVVSSLVDKSVQCWGCPVFDRLFQIVSEAAGATYEYFSTICMFLFCAMFATFVINAVIQNFKNDFADTWYKKSIQKVMVASVVAIGLLGMGVILPRTISSITFEPVAQVTSMYTQALIKQTSQSVEEKVTYQPAEMNPNGFYRPQLRDKIIHLMKITITQFQSYIKLGVAVIDKAFSWDALLGIGSLIKHIILFWIGVYLAYGFFRLFFKYCCYFVDVIVAMAFFAFFFPLSLVTMPFKDADSVPKWIGNIGNSVGVNQIKNLINAIVTLGSVVITYTVMMVIIAKFFSAPDASVNNVMDAITSGQIFADDLNTENLEAMTLASCVVLVYVLNFIYDQIPQITKMILDAFGVQEKNDYGDQLANDIMKLAKNVTDTAVNVGKKILSSDDKKDSK